MKTHRLTLLIAPAEKERIHAQAAALGISASEFVRKAANMLDADDIAALEDIHSLLPEFEAALGRMHDNLAAALDHSSRHEQERARMRTPAYREEILQAMAEDPAGVDAAAALFHVARPEQSQTEPGTAGGTLFERMSRIAGGTRGAHVAEALEPWQEEQASPPQKKTI